MPATLTCKKCGKKNSYASNKDHPVRLFCTWCGDGVEFTYDKKLVELTPVDDDHTSHLFKIKTKVAHAKKEAKSKRILSKRKPVEKEETKSED